MDKNAGKSVASTGSPSAGSPIPSNASAANAQTLSTQDQNNSNNNDGFKRTLSIFDMVIYGLIFMVPIAPFSIYGGVANASNGMASMAYLIAFVAMFFTVLSFGIMIKTFPSSGSIYTYASKSLGSAIGFIAGWLMLLQYLISPDMVFIIAAEPLHQYVPAVPVWVWCLIFLAIVLVVASRGIQTTMIVNKIALVCECIVLGMFL
ncbi:MAG: APC family permease, partial [Eggerthellaceae bacterium]